MSLSDDLANPPPRAAPTQCLTCRVMAAIDPQEAEDLQEAIHGEKWKDDALVELLTEKHGHEVTASSIANHRQKLHG